MIMKSPHTPLTYITLILHCLSHFTPALPSNTIGINYGQLGNNLPSHLQAIQLVTSMNFTHVKIYDTNPEILTLLSQTSLRVSIMVPNQQITTVASTQSNADQWVQENILPHYPSTRIRCVLVGNEIFSYNDMTIWLNLVPAMQNIKASLRKNNIHNIRVGTPLAMDVLESSFPPSSGRFRSDVPAHVILSLMRFLNGTHSFFFLDVYPYLAWLANQNSISLDFALLESGKGSYMDPGSGMVYTNLLDQMVDSVYFAMQRLGFDRIRIAISETGWPHGGGVDEPGANAYNAATYIRNLMMKVRSYPPLGTPARPGLRIPTFLFALFDENQKPGPETERNWGLLDSNGRPVYKVDFSFTGANPVENETVKSQNPIKNKPHKGRI